MANKRTLKKSIRTICGEIAGEALIASYLYADKIDQNKIDGIINEVAALQDDTINLTSFNFDKTERSFESKRDYRKARREYYAIAYKKLEKDFLDRATEIVKQLNDAVPAEVRKAVSKL